jgi:VIT1/CCC1 family predicted Fe2+/Mn2+ transporter
MSMAAGEYVSVSSQADTEKADLARETRELATQPDFEHAELAGIYRSRGLDAQTADAVATQLMAHDALSAHARDELGITDTGTAKPLQAALASAATFSAGAVLPLLVVLLLPEEMLVTAVAGSTLVFLILLGWLGARAGKAPPIPAIVRVAFWGSAAMAVTALIGRLAGTVV